MNQQIKNFLGYAAILAIIVFSYSAIIYVQTYSSSIQPSSFRSFSVSSEGKVVGKPDVAEFTYSVISEGGTNLADLQKQHVAKSTKVNAFVKQSGVSADDIKTENYSVEPKYEYYNCGIRATDGAKPCPPPKITGYSIRETLSVKVRDFEKVGPILGGIVDNGANSVSQLSFTIDDPTRVQNDARMSAIAKAKIKAESVAIAGGFKLGRLLGISEGSGPMTYFRKTMMSAESAGGGAIPAPAIEPGSQEVLVTVTLTYEIQ